MTGLMQSDFFTENFKDNQSQQPSSRKHSDVVLNSCLIQKHILT